MEVVIDSDDVVFFICFRETLETSIIVSVLLAFLKQSLGPDRDPATYKKLVRQVSLNIKINRLPHFF